MSDQEKDFDFNVDLENSEGLLPAGEYTAQCTDVEQKYSQSGNPMFHWTFEIEGVSVPLYTALVPAGMWKVAQTLRALGLAKDDAKKVRFNTEDAVGRVCLAVIEHQQFNGSTRLAITELKPGGKLSDKAKSAANNADIPF